jgi:ribosomal protein L37AE/L43A
LKGDKMPIFQTNVWVCEICNKCESTSEEVGPYSDPVVIPPNGIEWEYIKRNGKELLACPKCQETITEHREVPEELKIQCKVCGKIATKELLLPEKMYLCDFCLSHIISSLKEKINVSN